MQDKPSSKLDQPPSGMSSGTRSLTENPIPTEAEAFDLLMKNVTRLHTEWCPELAAQTLPLLDRRIAVIRQITKTLDPNNDPDGIKYNGYDTGHMDDYRRLYKARLAYGPQSPEAALAQAKLQKRINHWASQRGR